MSYGDFIREQRIKSGFKSQRRLADKSGISSATISRIESEIQKPELSTIRVLSEFLSSTTFSELMDACGFTIESVHERKTKFDWESFGLEMESKGFNPERISELVDFINKFKREGLMNEN